jgi:hypothetical protein
VCDGTVNIQGTALHVKGRQRDHFWLHIDNAATITLVSSMFLRNRMTDVIIPQATHVVMMNAHPERIEAYGTLSVEVRDENTSTWKSITLYNVAFVPKSNWNLLSWTAHADALVKDKGEVPVPLMTHRNTITLPVSISEEGKVETATGKRRNGLFAVKARSRVDKEKHALLATDKERHDSKESEKESEDECEKEPSNEESERKKEPSNDAEREKWGRVVLAKAASLVYEVHARTGHGAKLGAIQAMIRRGEYIVHNAEVKKAMMQMEPHELECTHCDEASKHKVHPSDTNTAQEEGQWTVDTAGPFPLSKSKKRFMSVWVAPEGKGVFLGFQSRKDHLLDVLRAKRRIWVRETLEPMLKLRMDRAGEQTGDDFSNYMSKHAIEPSYTAPGKSAGPSEAHIRTLQDRQRAMMNHYAKMHNTARPQHLWPEAMGYARDTTDMMPTSTNDGLSMYEKRTHKEPPLHKLHVWGATVVAHVPKELRSKNDNRGRKGRFMGFAPDGDGYRVYDPIKGTIFHSGSVRVYDHSATSVAPELATVDAQGGEIKGATLGRETSSSWIEGLRPAHKQEDGNDEKKAPLVEEPAPLVEELAFVEEEEPLRDVRPQRNRHPVQQINMGHDKWQSMATTMSKPPTATDKELQNEKRKKQQQEKRGIRLKESAVAIKVDIKLKVQRHYLAARRGGPAKETRLDQLMESGGQRGVASPYAVTDYYNSKRGSKAKGRGLQFGNTPNRPILPTGMVPIGVAEAMHSEDVLLWEAAMEEERAGMVASEAMEVASRDLMREMKRKSVGSKFVFDVKLRSPTCEKEGPTYRTLPDGKKVRYKARWVALGYSQREGVDFDADKIYAPTPQIDSVRLIMPYAFSKGWSIRQLDVKQAFLIPKLPEEEQVFLEPPPGDPLDADKIYKLLKCLYGLRQSAHKWNRDMDATLRRHGFTPTDGDQCVYVRYDENDELLCVLALHVDDVCVSAPDEVLEEIVGQLKSTYEMQDEEANWYLKIKIEKSANGKYMALSQPDYAADIVKTMGLEESNSVSTPMEVPLCKGSDEPMTEEEVEFMASKAAEYGTVTGMLTHLANMTRPDLAYSVAQLQRFTSCPRKKHWEAMKRIVRYLKGTLNHGLLFDKDHVNEGIIGAADSDWASDVDDRKSTSGYVFTFMGTAFAWKSKKQSDTGPSRSSATAELRALDLAAREGRWLRKMHVALRMPGSSTISIYEDNEACKNIANGSRWSNETKHVATQYFAVRDDVETQRIMVLPIASAENPADLFTKPVKPKLFAKFREMLGIVDVSSVCK